MNGRYISLETIIEMVYRDTGFIVDIDWVDIAEWVGSCLDLINAPMQYVHRITDGNDVPYIVIENNRGILPCDLVSIVETRTCEGYPMRYSTDSFHMKMHSAQCPDLICNSDITYKLRDNYIWTSSNFSNGKIEMAYLAFPTDERGYPLIPDDEVFKQAVVSFVAERIGKRLWMRNQLTGDKYQHLQQERAWYIGKAQTKPLIPNRDKTKSIENQFKRIVSFKGERNDGFKGISVEQILRNQSGYSNQSGPY